jgi:hypothetical protein
VNQPPHPGPTSPARPGAQVAAADEAGLATAADQATQAKPIAPVHGLLLVVAAWLAWRPVETFSWSATVVAAPALALAVWAWRRTEPAAAWTAFWVAAGVAVLGGLGLAGRDPAAAVAGAALVAAIAALIWLASRQAAPEDWPAVLALAVSGLTLWGLAQLAAGPEHAEAILAQLPEALHAAARERLAAGRAFASQPLPSHLAALLGTALPLLLARLRWSWRSVPWALGTVLCVVGLAATRSPIGILLALGACLGLAAARGGRAVRLALVALAAVLAAAVAARGDVLELDPVRLRLDNWRTAAWVWSTAPAAGVGFGGFGQAAQAVPLAVGNRPRHAHSLPMEALAELGPAGLLAVLAAGWALARLVRDLWPRRPELAAAIAVVPAHNLVDFSLAGSGVALPWAVLLGWALAVRGPTRVAGEGPRGRPLVVGVGALAVAAAVLQATSVTVLDAAASRTTPEERVAGALRAQRLAPWRTEALHLAAAAALESGDRALIDGAAAALEKARWLQPGSAALAGYRSLLGEARGHGPTAVAEAWAAQRAQPENPAHSQRLRSLLDRLQDDSRAPGR